MDLLAKLFIMIKDAIMKRWSGEFIVRLYFGKIKSVSIRSQVDLDMPVNMSYYRQRTKKEEPVGQ